MPLHLGKFVQMIALLKGHRQQWRSLRVEYGKGMRLWQESAIETDSNKYSNWKSSESCQPANLGTSPLWSTCKCSYGTWRGQ